MSELRILLSTQTDCRIVSPDEFMGVMVSRTSYVRSDEPNANMLGLRDEKTGSRILVKEEEFAALKLFCAQSN